MTFTALHRALGAEPGPLTDELLDEAVEAGVPEVDDLDWKAKLPPAKGLSGMDFPKDVAAMANRGGGVIAFGVRETQKAACGRVDVGEFDEAYERSLRQAAFTAISPPVLNLRVHRLGVEGKRAVILEIPPSVDGPHLVHHGQYFGAPVRNDADTVWMSERQIEAMYRARFDERRRAGEALDELFSEITAGADTDQRAWLVAVAHSRASAVRGRLTREEARAALTEARGLGAFFTNMRGGVHPLDSVDLNNPRPGLRRWVAVTRAPHEGAAWRETRASIHHHGSATLAAALGGHPTTTGRTFLPGGRVRSSAVECAIADFMALVRAIGAATGNDEYDLRVGLAWAGQGPLTILDTESFGQDRDGLSTPIHLYTPVETTVNTAESDVEFFWHVHDLAEDCVNQGGISEVRLIHPPARAE